MVYNDRIDNKFITHAMQNRPVIQDIVVQARADSSLFSMGEVVKRPVEVESQALNNHESAPTSEPIFATQIEVVLDDDSVLEDVDNLTQLPEQENLIAVPVQNVSLPSMPSPASYTIAPFRPDPLLRIETSIIRLMDTAHDVYQRNCHTAESQVFDPDYITRLSTNEFLFYTTDPLSLAEFEKLQNRLVAKAKTLPNGIHLILGSFAVLTPNNTVMNVTAYLRCGPTPECNFIVKNHTSSIDYRYTQMDALGNSVKIPTYDKAMHTSTHQAMPSITVDGKDIPFQFYNLFECTTPGGLPFLTAVDICLDHYYGVAYHHYGKLIQTHPQISEQFISHVLIANHGATSLAKMLEPLLLHVDPDSTETRKGVVTAKPQTCDLDFGYDPCDLFVLPPCPMLKPSENLAVILRENLSHSLRYFGITVFNPVDTEPFTLQFQDRLTFLCLKRYFTQHAIRHSSSESPYRIRLLPEFFNKNYPINNVENMRAMLCSPAARHELIRSVQPIHNPYPEFTTRFAQFKSRYQLQHAEFIETALNQLREKIEQAHSLSELEALQEDIKASPEYTLFIKEKDNIDEKTPEEASIDDMLEQKRQILSENPAFTALHSQ